MKNLGSKSVRRLCFSFGGFAGVLMKDGFGVVFCVVVEKIGGLRLFKMGVFAMVTSEMIGMVDVFGFIFLLFGDTGKEGLIFLGIFRSEKSGNVIEGSIVREGFLVLFES